MLRRDVAPNLRRIKGTTILPFGLHARQQVFFEVQIFLREDVSTMIEKAFSNDSGHLDTGENEDILFLSRMPKTLHWSVPWSDLMMTMFVLFVILFVYHASGRPLMFDKEKEAAMGAHAESDAQVTIRNTGDLPEPQGQSMSNLYDLSKETVRANDLDDFASVDLVPDKAVRIVLTGDLLFDTGQADLKPEAEQSLERIAAIIRRTPYMVNVVGHTDDVPINSERFPTNWELSAIRASQVARFLSEEMGIGGERFFITGHAYHQPMFPNDSASHRATNRRVEIIITKERPYGKSEVLEDVLSPGLLEGARQSTGNRWPWNTLQ
jgi:chemotaxis protein MotB